MIYLRRFWNIKTQLFLNNENFLNANLLKNIQTWNFFWKWKPFLKKIEKTRRFFKHNHLLKTGTFFENPNKIWNCKYLSMTSSHISKQTKPCRCIICFFVSLSCCLFVAHDTQPRTMGASTELPFGVKLTARAQKRMCHMYYDLNCIPLMRAHIFLGTATNEISWQMSSAGLKN